VLLLKVMPCATQSATAVPDATYAVGQAEQLARVFTIVIAEASCSGV
jgi:hypothetical protein